MISLRKPLNVIDTPEYPDIKKRYGRFAYARKYWQVDTGEVLKETEKYPMFMENIIEYQSRNRNETMYGKVSSQGQYVNENFRYPLIAPIDLEPLSRKPITDAIVPRVNPSIPEGCYVVYDNMVNDIKAHLTDRVRDPRFVVPSYR